MSSLSPWSSLWRSDIFRLSGTTSRLDLLRLLARSRTYRPIYTARLCQSFDQRGCFGRVTHMLFRQAHKWTQNAAGIDLPWEIQLGPGVAIMHGWGLVISPDARIGGNVTLFHGVTLGRKDEVSEDGTRTVGGSPILADGVWIGPHSVVLGPVHIGRNARVAAGSVVLNDVPDGAIVAGNPARIVRRNAPSDIPNPWPLESIYPTVSDPLIAVDDPG